MNRGEIVCVTAVVVYIYMFYPGYTRGLSLTHCIQNNIVIPLEVSVCSEPARPFCFVYFIGFSQIGAQDYKSSIMQKHRADPVDEALTRETQRRIVACSAVMTDPSNESGKSLVEQAIDSMDPEKRSVVAARLSEMSQIASEAHSARLAAEAKYEAARKEADDAKAVSRNSTVDVGMLKDQLRILRQNVGPDLESNYYISESQCKDVLASDSPNQVLQLVNRVVCAANMKMMHDNAQHLRASASAAMPPPSSTTDHTRKRKHVNDPAVPTPDTRSHFERALADTFML